MSSSGGGSIILHAKNRSRGVDTGPVTIDPQTLLNILNNISSSYVPDATTSAAIDTLTDLANDVL